MRDTVQDAIHDEIQGAGREGHDQEQGVGEREYDAPEPAQTL